MSRSIELVIISVLVVVYVEGPIVSLVLFPACVNLAVTMCCVVMLN